MILNFWPDVFLAFFWNIPGCLSPQKMVGKPSNASASPELWSCDAGSTIDVTGHLGFIGNRWWMEIGNHQEITSKSAAQLRSPQTNWDTHGKLSIPLSLAWRQRFTQWISWGPLRARARARSAVQLHRARSEAVVSPPGRLNQLGHRSKKIKTPKSPGLSSFSNYGNMLG